MTVATAVDENERDAGVVDEIINFVASTPPKSFFLFAGAGSGKTRTLVAALRVLTGVESRDPAPGAARDENEPSVRFARDLRARAQTIRVITFTKNAALVVTGRLGLNDLTRVTTIHSFCWELIAGFNDDIREAMLALNAESLAKACEAANARTRGPTPKDKETIAELEAKAAALASTLEFTYSPDRKRHGDGALNHTQVLNVASWTLRNRPTLRQILRDQHPVILIDESQDTMKSVIDALLEVVAEDRSRLMLGLLGDHRQRIYMDGHTDLASVVPSDWETPKLQMNHRSQRRIVDLINDIWDSELQGRTQSNKAVRQHPRKEKSGGTVRLFIGDATAKPDEKLRRERLCEAAMEAVTGETAWRAGDAGHHTLALEHRLVARRGDFLEAFDALALLDPDAVRPEAGGETTGPAAVQVLLREMMDLAKCVDENGQAADFLVTEVMHRYGRLLDLPDDGDTRLQLLDGFQQAINQFAALCDKPGVTVREILAPILRFGVFEADKRLREAYDATEPPPEVPKQRQSELLEHRLARGWHGLFLCPWVQLRRFKAYLAGESSLATHQVVKGSEFEHVMVVMDDEDAGGFLFAYDRLFGAPPGDSDISNAGANKETSIDRTLRLLYVTCSRAKESLALVLWARDADQALAYASSSKWFLPGEVLSMPE